MISDNVRGCQAKISCGCTCGLATYSVVTWPRTHKIYMRNVSCKKRYC